MIFRSFILYPSCGCLCIFQNAPCTLRYNVAYYLAVLISAIFQQVRMNQSISVELEISHILLHNLSCPLVTQSCSPLSHFSLCANAPAATMASDKICTSLDGIGISAVATIIATKSINRNIAKTAFKNSTLTPLLVHPSLPRSVTPSILLCVI